MDGDRRPLRQRGLGRYGGADMPSMCGLGIRYVGAWPVCMIGREHGDVWGAGRERREEVNGYTTLQLESLGEPK